MALHCRRYSYNILQEMKKPLIALLLVTSGLYWLLRPPVPSENDVIGVYTAARGGYHDQVKIMPDYKFVQTLKTPNGATITNKGNWTLTNRSLDIGDYSFFIDTVTDEVLNEPLRSSSFPFAVYPDMLIRDWSSDYYRLNKQ